MCNCEYYMSTSGPTGVNGTRTLLTLCFVCKWMQIIVHTNVENMYGMLVEYLLWYNKIWD